MRAIEAIRRGHDEGRPLPGLAYSDPEVFRAETESIFPRTWISVACGQNVARPGEVFPVRIAGRSLLVLRDGEGRVRVFYNLCRHRGAPLADAPCRPAGGRLVCPYHAWSYGLDGELVSAPHLGEGGGRELDLLPVRSAVWRDVVFVNLSGEAPAFSEFIRPLDERLAPWTAGELRPLASDEYRIEANWKLAAENFLDTYHLPIVHPQIGGGFGGALATEDVEVSDDVVGLVMPQGYGEGSGQADGTLPLFSGLGADRRLRIETFAIFPNTLILVEPDNQQVIVLRPQSPTATEETFANYLVSEASAAEHLAKARDAIYRLSVQVNDQDAALLARLQGTRSMEVGGDTRLVDAWDVTNRRFQRLWTRRLLSALA